MVRASLRIINVVTLSSPEQYESFLNEIKERGNIGLLTRRKLARLAFENTAHYESVISNWFNKDISEFCSKKSSIPLKKIKDLRYGENPHQSGSYYEFGDNKITQINGKNLSFNNIYDLESAVTTL